MVEDLRERQYRRIRKKVKIRRICTLLLAVLLITGLYFAAFLGQRKFEVTYYTISSEKVKGTVRAVVLSDLHSCEYGEGNSNLIGEIAALKPDMILMIGDMLNKEEPDVPRLSKLCENLLKTAPVYYTSGNHESEIMNSGLKSIPLDDILKEKGVFVLTNSSKDLELGDTTVRIIGIPTNAKNYGKWSKAKVDQYIETDEFKILMSHYPSLYYEKLKDVDVDVALAGHYHGGLIRIPWKGGLYHPEGGFFPRYDGGMYPLTNAELIVSRGIGSHGLIPRINNEPELVVVDITNDTDTN